MIAIRKTINTGTFYALLYTKYQKRKKKRSKTMRLVVLDDECSLWWGGVGWGGGSTRGKCTNNRFAYPFKGITK
ncbi:hypothetical protein KY285_018919 [Solanum tuberosum]|nr:hypothetical protein KY284_017953 [Solanum tuberosum]KAH0690760.1 hypothetical protein KY289_018118 [Solanum tuberosum]KAH0704641.1 hypothetical protein KY285_018919 [Solanum tuberosum]